MRRPAIADIAITAGFATLFAINLAHHQLWRDEIFAWMIALTSPTPLALIQALHYDGHPGLWHSLLWLASRVTWDPATVKLLHGAIGLALIGMIGLAAPLSRLERVLLLAGYFVAFEYTVISRNYGIGMLLALLYARQRVAAPDRVLANSALLALLANANIYCTILSGVLAMEYLVARIGQPGRRRLMAGAALYAAGFALVVVTVWPAPDLSREMTQPLALLTSPGHFVRTFLRFVDVGLVPVRATSLAWQFALFSPANAPFSALWPQMLAAAALLAALAWIFRREPALLAVLGLTVLGAVAFGHVVYAVAVRHWGIVTVAFVTCLWMQRARAGRGGIAPSFPVLALLALGAAGGVQAMVLQWSLPFSRSQTTAQWIAAAGLADRPLIGTPDTHAGMVAALLGREITMPECRCTARRPILSAGRDGFRRADLPAALAALAPPGREAVFIAGWRLAPEEVAAVAAAGITLVPVVEMTGAWVDEEFFVYRLGGGGAPRLP